ncbi:MAG TPA: DUF4159 domain-containing protein [Anaerolineaceae bacterium]|nr:DUF4159 domain-containing protein [Anaerolineaceae bacterium]
MKDTFSLFPKKHLLPYDGMSITANVWTEAHTYHRQMLNAHQIFMHGSGIITGLEVVASDPADTVVFVLPGAAVDDAGQMIVLTEPVAYDLGKKIDGRLHLLLLHREVKANGEESEESNGPAYLKDEFVIIARPDMVDVPHVELARIFRQSANDPISDAADPNEPQPNTLDLRFRRILCPPPVEQVLAGVCYLGSGAKAGFARGLARAGKALAETASYQMIVDDNVSLDQAALAYRLLYLVGSKGASLSEAQAQILRGFVEAGGKILVDFSEAMDDDKAVVELLKPAGIQVKKVAASDPIYQAPFLFAVPPKGSCAPAGKAAAWSDGNSAVCVNAGYGPVWNGQTTAAPLERSEIRDATEWGVNLLVNLLNQA